MAHGVDILGTRTKPCKVRRIGRNVFGIILTQGLNRQIRRMCAAFDYNVRRLQRVRIVNIRLDGIRPGSGATSRSGSGLLRIASSTPRRVGLVRVRSEPDRRSYQTMWWSVASIQSAPSWPGAGQNTPFAMMPQVGGGQHVVEVQVADLGAEVAGVLVVGSLLAEVAATDGPRRNRRAFAARQRRAVQARGCPATG
jgi:hypothetical protein